MPGQLVAIVASLAAASALAGDLAAGLRACRSESEAGPRLACYDALSAKPPILELSGAGSAVTPVFAVAEPSLLRFESRDAIMVAYLLGPKGEVVQNLHHGGAGEGSFLIERAGAYRVQVNASGGWRIRVEAP
jgi:hypothetical protein